MPCIRNSRQVNGEEQRGRGSHGSLIAPIDIPRATRHGSEHLLVARERDPDNRAPSLGSRGHTLQFRLDFVERIICERCRVAVIGSVPKKRKS